MIHHEEDHSKTKFLNQNVAAHHNGAHHPNVAHHHPMIRDVGCGHARRDVGAPVSCARVTTELGVSVASATSASVKRAESLHRKVECANGYPSPQAGGGISAANSSGGVSSSAVKSSRDGYREKALEEIRNSLKPYATSDAHGEGIYDFSSASSSTSESSGGVCQNVGNWANAPHSSGPNGLSKNLNIQQALQHLAAIGHNEELGPYMLKVSDKCGKDEQTKSESHNGVAKVTHANSFKYRCQQKILDVHEGVGSDNYSSQNGFRTLDTSSRQDGSNVCITGLRHKIFPDPPKLIYGSSLANCEVTSNYAHNPTRQPVLDYCSSDVPPPLPPPRGTVPPPPTPPRGTPPLPPSVTIGTSQQEVPYCTANSITSAAQKPYLRRMSPVPASSRQILNYTSSAGSTPQRGTSPITSGRTPMIVTNNAQIHQQLAQQLQALSVSSSSSCISSASRNDSSSVYGGTSQNGNNPSWYSSPQPSYASSSSGRHSPTPTISSSEYSIPPVFQMKRTPPPAYTPPSSYSSSPQTVPQHHSPSPAASVMMSVLPRPAALQAWSSRQAKSQSPVIMQSVKSTQVQKPVLQTAVAPTSPQTPSASPAFPTVCQPQQVQPVVSSPPPPPYPVQKSQLTVTKSSDAPPVDNKCLILPSSNTVSAHMRTMDSQSNPPPLYPRNQNKPPSPMTGAPPPNQVTDPPPYPMPTAVVQPAVPPSPPPPPYTSAVWQGLQNPTQTTSNVPLSFITSYSQKTMQDIPVKESSSCDVYPGVESNQNKWQDMHQPPPAPDKPHIECCTQSSVPTTDPPSYASSMAAMMSAQRAAALMTMLNNNNNNVPSVMNSGQTSTPQSVTAVMNSAYTDPMDSSNCVTKASSLVNTVESICTSQITALPGPCLNPGNANINGMLEDPFSFLEHHHHHNTVIRKPSPVAMDTASSVSLSASRSESPVSRAANQSPVSFMSTTSTSSPSTQSDSTHDSSNKLLVLHKVMHQSPPPPRKILSKEKENERRETKVRNYSPAAFKFYMEQHVENVLKSHQQRERRRQQLETEMAKVGLSKEAQCEIRKMLHQKESNYIRLKRAKMNKSMFNKIKTIGIGAFGEVALVKKKDTADHFYAMKILRKSDVLKRNQVAHVKAERDILAEADNEWVVKLYYSFQDDDNLYFVMDYIPGGDLMSLLIKFGIFSEPLARFYIAELVLAVESVHKMGFIHRDIKPDNILIDRNGHIKLTDFGLCTGFRWTHNSKYYQRNGEHGRQDSMDFDDQWSNECHCKPSANLKPLERRRRREHQRCLAHSLVGTPNYIAPEVLRKTGYTQLCDWWSVGVILYEMLIGQPPFLASTSAETQLKVINWETSLRIPKKPDVTTEAADLILKLCCCADSRLGRNGSDEIKRHMFFRDIDFNSDLRRQPAPYVPEIRHAADTSNFDPIDSDKLRSSNSESSDEGNMDDPNDNKHPEHAFLEFTFRRFFDQDGGHVYPLRNNNDEPEKQSSPVYV